MRMRLLLYLGLFLLPVSFLSAQASLEGKVIDTETGEPVIFATVALYKGGILVTGTETDIDGYFIFSSIDPGTYDVEASYVGYQSQRTAGVVVLAGKSNKLNIELGEGVLLETIEVVEYKVPLIEQDNTTQGQVVTAEKIRNLPTKGLNQIAATTAGLSSIDDGAIAIRGSRSNATDYYIDGIRVSGRLLPQTEIDQMQVITGGMEAQYGDVTGGVISITTKGPSSTYSAYAEIESSELTDAYGYNLANLTGSGPLLKNKAGQTVLGFRLASQFLYRRDDDPPATGTYRATEEAINRYSMNPVTLLGRSQIPTAEYASEGNGDVRLLDANPNEDELNLDLTGKLDARLGNGIDMSVTGTFNQYSNRFSNGRAWEVYNWTNNPIDRGNTYRGILRLRHRLGGSGPSGVQKTSMIRNASYTLQFGYERRNRGQSDYTHGDNIFNYGYIGDFEYEWTPGVAAKIIGENPVYSNAFCPGGREEGFPCFQHDGFAQRLVGYNAGNINPTLAAYNQVLGEPGSTLDPSAFNAINGTIANNVSNVWLNLHSNVGQVYNRYAQTQQDRITMQATSAFDFLPGGSEKGRHNIQFGFLYEERVDRSWVVNPRDLWTVARQTANNHIIGVDTNVIVGQFEEDGVVFDQFRTAIAPGSDAKFYREVRRLVYPDIDLSDAVHLYVNSDGLNPSDLSIGMFGARELNDQDLLEYRGYDYTGQNRLTGVKFEDFFTARDEEGRRTYPVAPYNPVYAAGFIQDKFTFKDIIFRLGVRLDYFDANTKVLKDPYSLYEVMSAADFHDMNGTEKPAAVGDDYKVYVDGPNSNNVIGYRSGDTWFNVNGTTGTGNDVFFASDVVNPKYTRPDVQGDFIKDPNFDPSLSFQDYKPQINVMPRMAFSFPISEDANFFAHYDILVQRPPSNNIATALDYFYFPDSRESVWNNPNLLPERTVDYEVGFKQKVSNTSAITVTAYYKELRDMIQRRRFFFSAPISEYETYDNIDFGTVKGFSFNYDLRRTGNVEMNVAYTLQFADGTGSDVNSARGLTNNRFIRNIFPLSYDERHRIAATLDYRYFSGKKYTGPRLFGSDIFANTGLNLLMVAVSGRPYTKTTFPRRFTGVGFAGAFNGARLPWNFTTDLRIDKSFRLYGSGDGYSPNVNVYVRVQNLFDTRNVIGVYSASGSPEDDGYLSSQEGRDVLNEVRDVELYLQSYSWRLLNPDFYTLPRRIFLGAIFEF
jgi:outer membrane receptor protein involved in Fe transport